MVLKNHAGRELPKKQLIQNISVKKASELLMKDSGTQGKSITKDWKASGAKNRREIKVDGEVVFRQDADHLTGVFFAPFQHLTL